MKQVIATVKHRHGAHLWFGLALATIFVVITLLQLFTFEDMPVALRMLMPKEWTVDASILTAIIVSVEVFAIPYFLPIALSTLARICSGVFAISVPLVWVTLNLHAVLEGLTVRATYLSPKVSLDASILSVTSMLFMLGAVVGLMLVDRRHKA